MYVFSSKTYPFPILICKFCWDVQFILAIQQKKKKIPPFKTKLFNQNVTYIFHEYNKFFVCNMKNSKALKLLNLKRMLIVKTGTGMYIHSYPNSEFYMNNV